MNGKTRTATSLPHFGGNVNPFSEKIILTLNAQNEGDVKCFWEILSEIFECAEMLVDFEESLDKAYFEMFVNPFGRKISEKLRLRMFFRIMEGYKVVSDVSETLADSLAALLDEYDVEIIVPEGSPLSDSGGR